MRRDRERGREVRVGERGKGREGVSDGGRQRERKEERSGEAGS